MDLLDQIEQVQHPKVTYDTQVVRQVSSSESESELDAEVGVSDVDNEESNNTADTLLMDRLAAIRNRITHENVDNDDEENTDTLATQVIDTRLPQLEIDESEIGFSEVTQKVTETPEIRLEFQNTQVITMGDENKSIEERTRLLIEQKRKERELNKKELEYDISNVTLTDEENDEYNRSTVFNSANTGKKSGTRDLNEAQKFLDNQKKEQFFDKVNRRGAGPKKKFSAASFVNAFTEEFQKPAAAEDHFVSSNDEHDQADETEEGGIKLGSPATSPINESSKSHIGIQNPIEIYKQNLKQFDEIDLEINENEVPVLTKDLKLSIKQKFLRANISKFNKHFKNGKLDSTGHKYLQQLFSMSVDQLSANSVKNFDDIEEEKNEEIMGSLLEREIERARAIRRQEKLKQKAKLALLGKNSNSGGEDEDEDGDYNEGGKSDWDESEVPNSDIDSDLELSEASEVDEGEQSEAGHYSDDDDEHFSGIGIKRKTKIMESDDESEQNVDSDKEQGISISYKDDSFHNSQLFKNLQPIETLPESHDIEETFEEISPSQINNQSLIELESQLNLDKSTQVDRSTQKDDTQIDNLTQIVNNQLGNSIKDSTQIDKTQLIGSIIEENEDITPEMVSKGRKSIKHNHMLDSQDDEQEVEEEEEPESEEQIQERIKQYEAKIRKKELNMVRRRKEMERKGYNKIIEGEAEESEDEWAGLGGKDGEHDEDGPDSEDERMIDNNFNIDLNNEEVRNKFMEQYQIKDKKELEKLVDDIKNHKLVKRSNGLDIELSDEEDQILLNYRKQKLKEQKLKLQQMNKSLSKFKTENSKAFFESIEDDLGANSKIHLDDDLEENDDPEEDEQDGEESDQRSEEKSTKSIKIGEEFIRQKLSFLTESVNDYEMEQRKSNFQYDISDSEEEDLNTLKQKSLTNLRKRRLDEIEIETDDDQEVDEEDKEKENREQLSDINEDDFEDDLLPTRKPSMIKSFISSQSSKSASFSGVTVSKQYKTASGSKASITFMSKKKKPKLSKLQASRKFTPKIRQNLHQR